MSLGPGKYDEFATALREVTRAKGVILMVVDGRLGTGFSVQADAQIIAKLPYILRDVAQEIETDAQKIQTD